MVTPGTTVGIGFFLALVAGLIWIIPLPGVSRSGSTKIAKFILYVAIFSILIGSFRMTGLADWAETVLYKFLR